MTSDRVMHNSPGLQSDLILHPFIHTSAPSESSTNCGSGFFRGKVWIKVCNSQFQENGMGVYLLTTQLNHQNSAKRKIE